jgi:hypothetical protein
MRCLFCGKELALFKRLTGGGEFCSDAHRQKYQEEYNQLALSRLLQASPVGENAGGKSGSPRVGDSKGLLDVVGVTNTGPATFDPPAESPRIAESSRLGESQKINLVPEPAPHAGANGNSNGPYYSHQEPGIQEAAAEPADEAIPPAEPGGFFLEVPPPAVVAAANIALSGLDMVWRENLLLPSSQVTAQQNAPSIAGTIALETKLAFQTITAMGSPNALEMRETTRPLVGANAEFPVGDSVGLEATVKTMEIHILPTAPQSATLIWEDAAKEFAESNPQLGDLGRLAFVTLGWEESGASLVPPSHNAIHAAVERSIEAVEVRLDDRAVEPEPEPAAQEFAKEIEPPAAPEPIPSVVTKPLPMTLHGHAPSRGKPVQVFPSAIARAAGVQIPRSTALPLRPTMVFGPAPAPPRPKAEPTTTVKPAPIAPVKQETAKIAPKPEVRTPDIKNIVKTAPTVKLPPIEKKDAPKPPSSAPVEIKPAETKPVIENRAVEPKPVEAKPIEAKPIEAKKVAPVPAPEAKQELPAPPQTDIKGRRPEIRTITPPRPEPRKQVELKPEPKPSAPEPRVEAKIEVKPPEPKLVKRDEPKDVIKEKAAAPPVEAKVEPKPKREPAKETISPVPAPFSAPESFEEAELSLPHLGTEVNEGFWSKLPVAAKALIGLVVVAGLVFGGIYLSKQNTAPAVKAPVVVAAGTVLSSGDAGWETDWAPDPPLSKRQRRVNVMRASQSLSDYRLEFEGQIETKALGWVYRASNPKNFYVEKVEIVKPGLEPVIRLVRFAVVDGVEQPHQDVPLTVKVRPDTMYKIRFEAVGDHFTTWILDQKVDEWSDSHISTGGVGLYSEAGESLSLKGGLNLAPLVVKR